VARSGGYVMVMGLGWRGVPRPLPQYGSLAASPKKWKYDVQICKFWCCILTIIKSEYSHGLITECRCIWGIPNNFSSVLCKAVTRGVLVFEHPEISGINLTNKNRSIMSVLVTKFSKLTTGLDSGYRFWPGHRPVPHWGAYSTLPDP